MSSISEKDAPAVFEEELNKIFKGFNNTKLLLTFDEIENITFSVSPSPHWTHEKDYIFFWQTMRAIFQRNKNIFTILLSGTNPLCVETPTIDSYDNPLFNQIPFEYLPGFDVPQTKEMVLRLGRFMGLLFDELLYGRLTEDYGGHAFLIRHVCSVINKLAPKMRPVKIGIPTYEEARRIFDRDYSSYIDMILTVLKNCYNDEYSMLEYLARRDIATFDEFAKLSPYYTNHLMGYGIIAQDDGGYYFRIDSLKRYLAKKGKYSRMDMTNEDRQKEVSERRNRLEPIIRNIIRTQLIAKYGREMSRKIMLQNVDVKDKTKMDLLEYSELFNPRYVNIYQ